MSLIADTGGLYALFDADDQHHQAATEVVRAERGQIFVPVALLAELDYLLLEYLGIDAEKALLDDLIRGAFTLEPLVAQDLERIREIVDQYRDLRPGLADAAVIATSERLGIDRILTVDERDFRAMVPKSGKPLTLLPADRG